MISELDFELVDDVTAPIQSSSLSIARGHGLRPYQGEAIEAVHACFAENEKSVLVTAATGTGKTPIIATLAKIEAQSGGKVLVLAHTDELIEQAIDKIRRFSGINPAKEKAESYATFRDVVVVGSVQTMSRENRLTVWRKDHFTLILVDEAHRTLAESYLKILNYFREGGAKVVGVTATADRGDKQSLGSFYERIAFEYSLLRAVHDGWLVRPIVKTMPLAIDIKGVHSTRTANGSDLDQVEVAHRLVPFMSAIAAQVKASAPNGKIVYFLPSVETALKMAEAVRATGMTCDAIHGESKDRDEILEKYRSGATQAICNVMLLTEGWDHDEVDTLVILRPTKIRSLYVQMAGRACRPLNEIVPKLNAAPNAYERLKLIEGSKKKSYTIIDFLWLYEKHDLVRPAALVTDKPRVAELMDQVDGDLIDAEKKAERDLLKKLEEEVRKHAAKKARVVDPLAVATELGDVELATYEPETARDALPVTEGQMKVLLQNGINCEAVKCRGHASKLIGLILRRHEAGLCTIRQLHFFAKLGVDASMWTRDEASREQHERISRWQARAAQKKAEKRPLEELDLA